MFRIILGSLACLVAFWAPTYETIATIQRTTKGTINENTSEGKGEKRMKLGAFSVSLAVKDIAKSREFYEKLGFKAFAGNQDKKWLILQNETTTIGLFQGVFEKNILTFNPGWDGKCATLPDFEDVRDIQRALKASGLTLTTQADEAGKGPGSLTLLDPDGNQILLDQHVASPKK